MATRTSHQLQRASTADTQGIIGLSSRVQADLTSKGSLQIIGPLTHEEVENSMQNGHIFILEKLENNVPTTKIGGVILDHYSNNYPSLRVEIEGMPGKKWFLHALMVDPKFQGEGLGGTFLRDVLKEMLYIEGDGIVLLDCFAGNAKLRVFYESVGFKLLREVPEEDYLVAVFAYHLTA